MTRAVFITDQHLCKALRWSEAERLMAWSVPVIAELKPDVIEFGGDLFERKPDVEELRAAARWLVQLAHIAPVQGVRGNHDPVGLSVFNLLRAPHPIYFAERAETRVVGGIEHVLLPWPLKAELLARLAAEKGLDDARQLGSRVLVDLLAALGQTEGGTLPRCFVGHVQRRGAKAAKGQPMAPGAEFEIADEELALAQCDAYLLGHIHRPDLWDVNGKPGLYGGSFRRADFGETEDKFLTVVDFGARGEPVRVERVLIPCQRLLLVEATWDEELSALVTGTCQAMTLLIDDDLSGADMRLRYVVPADQRDQARERAEEIAAGWRARGAADVKLEDEVKPVGAARAPKVAEARSLVEKLGALWDARLDWPDQKRAERLLDLANEIEREVAHAI